MGRDAGAEDEEATHDQGRPEKVSVGHLVALARSALSVPFVPALSAKHLHLHHGLCTPSLSLGHWTGTDPQLSRPSLSRTLRLASINAASTAAWAYSGGA